jgi:hypothetical protein
MKTQQIVATKPVITSCLNDNFCIRAIIDYNLLTITRPVGNGFKTLTPGRYNSIQLKIYKTLYKSGC